MKKVIAFIFTAGFMAEFAAFAACSQTELQAPELPAPTNIHFEQEDLITWDKVEGAGFYIVETYGSQQEVDSNYFTFEPPEENTTIKIMAVSNNLSHSDSEWAEYLYEAPTPALKYTLTDDGSGYEVSSQDDSTCEGLEGRVVIPDFFNDMLVVGIANNAFRLDYSGNSLNEDAGLGINNVTTSFRLPSHLKSIGSGAFSYCIALEEIVIPPSVEYIGSGAFSTCLNLKKITLPPNITELYNTFINCESLTEISIPSSVQTLSTSAFSYCYSLRSVTIPQGLKYIGRRVFFYCCRLKNVIISNSVEEIRLSAFSECYRLKNVFYCGTEEQFNQIAYPGLSSEINSIAYYNAATKYFYSEEQPTEEGNFWHYAEDGKTPLIWD